MTRRRRRRRVPIERGRRQRVEVVLAAVVGRRRRPPSAASPGRQRRRAGGHAVGVPPVAMSRRRTRFQIVEIAVPQVDFHHADVVAAGAVGIRNQPEGVGALLLVAPDVDHAAVAVEREDDRTASVAAATAPVRIASKPRRARVVVLVLGQYLRVLHEQVVLLRHAAGRTTEITGSAA